MLTLTKKNAAIVGSAIALSLGGGAIATAATTAGDQAGSTTASDTRPADGPGRGGPGPRMNTAALAKELGVTEAKLRAAFDAIRPAQGDRAERRSDRAAAIAKALGVSQSDVQEVLDANRPERPATAQAKPARPDQSKLIAALAAKFDVSEAKAKAAVDAAEAAHRKSHEARHAEMAAKLAKELDLSTEKVQAALEATRPERPARP